MLISSVQQAHQLDQRPSPGCPSRVALPNWAHSAPPPMPSACLGDSNQFNPFITGQDFSRLRAITRLLAPLPHRPQTSPCSPQTSRPASRGAARRSSPNSSPPMRSASSPGPVQGRDGNGMSTGGRSFVQGRAFQSKADCCTKTGRAACRPCEHRTILGNAKPPTRESKYSP